MENPPPGTPPLNRGDVRTIVHESERDNCIRRLYQALVELEESAGILDDDDAALWSTLRLHPTIAGHSTIG